MEYPYINLDLLQEYAVCFYGHVSEWASTMRHAVSFYDGEPFNCFMAWRCLDNDCYYLRNTGFGYTMTCTTKDMSPYPVITIEELIEMSNPSIEYDFSNELQTLLDI